MSMRATTKSVFDRSGTNLSIVYFTSWDDETETMKDAPGSNVIKFLWALIDNFV